MGQLQSVKIVFALICLLALEGCASVALSIAGLAAGKGIDHTLSGTVERTFASPVAGTYLATLQTLKRMGMTVENSEQQDSVWKIDAVAEKRKIQIELEALSDLSTQVGVVVSQSDFVFFKDSSTGIGILDQISVDLSGLTVDRHRFATVQMLLVELGYDPGGIDGLKGKNTRNAILRFQREHAIQPDGDIDRELIAMLRHQKAALEIATKNPEEEKLR
ncbi:MAG: DUF3568 family protein [Alphaproteobacteria bacterium]|nr:DUF3568 family protein [Alphaproteobacteria bacterium]